ncbi:Magnesium transporter MRS2-F [Camellia lanceoleosa]|uniref:Magnesium transporter MRS2-F n=1 Tax=Camellia lanceoleosa TaxID=1840588 RepID=A0ACC0FW17_9ERIC|nr:Magnesium transporter MRS2-F [Camellia lanceoleosa]
MMLRSGVQANDLRVVESELSNPSAILRRERAIVVNLEHIKAIITADEVLVPNPKDPFMGSFVCDLEFKLSDFGAFLKEDTTIVQLVIFDDELDASFIYCVPLLKLICLDQNRLEEQARKEKEELERMLEKNRRKVQKAQMREALEQQWREEERYRELEELQRQKEEAMRRKKQQEEEECTNQTKVLVLQSQTHTKRERITDKVESWMVQAPETSTTSGSSRLLNAASIDPAPKLQESNEVKEAYNNDRPRKMRKIDQVEDG